jgi:retrograde regulation protein 2
MALMLEARYEGELPPRETTFKADLMALLTAEEAWWVGYLGKIAYMISRLYPSGFVDVKEPRVAFKAEWADDLGKEGKDEGLRLVVSIHTKKNDPMKLAQALRDHARLLITCGQTEPNGRDELAVRDNGTKGQQDKHPEPANDCTPVHPGIRQRPFPHA